MVFVEPKCLISFNQHNHSVVKTNDIANAIIYWDWYTAQCEEAEAWMNKFVCS